MLESTSMHPLDNPTPIASPARDNKLDFIQALRGISALLVMMYHFQQRIAPGEFAQTAGAFFFGRGYVGVDIFFMLSGFVMVYSTARITSGASDAVTFFIKRIARVWPAYVIATVLYLAIHLGDFGINQLALDQFLKSIVFLPQANSGAPFFGYATLTLGWSLNYEMYFYLIFGCSLIFGKSKRWLVLAAWFALTLLLIPAFKRTLSFDIKTEYLFSVDYFNLMVNPIIWGFLIGMAVGKAYLSTLRISSAMVLRCCLLAMTGVVVWQYLSGFLAGHGVTHNLIPIAALFLLIALAEKNTPFAWPAWLVWMGEISFSLYLLHIPVIDGINKLMTAYGNPALNGHASTVVLGVFATLAVVIPFHHFIEKRLSSLLSKWLLATFRAGQRRALRLAPLVAVKPD
jgi:exopolysaccharide production protein ExoZ